MVGGKEGAPSGETEAGRRARVAHERVFASGILLIHGDKQFMSQTPAFS